MKILVVEDDYMQADWIRNELAPHFSGADILIVSSAVEFLQTLDELVEDPPDAVLIDIMLRISDPEEGQVTPKDTDVGWYRRAGVHCYEQVRKKLKTKEGGKIPVVIYTVLSRAEVAQLDKYSTDNRMAFVEKSSSGRSLVAALQAQLRKVQ